MPSYDYRCLGCGRLLEFAHPMSERPNLECPHCGARLRRVITTTPHVRLEWKAYDRNDTGNEQLVIRAGRAGKSQPLSNASGERT